VVLMISERRGVEGKNDGVTVHQASQATAPSPPQAAVPTEAQVPVAAAAAAAPPAPLLWRLPATTSALEQYQSKVFYVAVLLIRDIF
jgi:hypothetical protein